MQTLTAAMPFQPVERVEARPFRFGTREVLLMLAHVPLALAMNAIPEISTVYAWATVAVALVIALKAPRPEPLVYMCAYIAGSEVLWRMTEAQILVQFGKYSITGIFMIGLLRFHSPKSSPRPLLYFALLLPSIALTFLNSRGASDLKENLSYNLSGPFAFVICAWFFSRLWLLAEDIPRIFFWLLAPSAGICAVTIYATLTAQEIRFITESNWTTSADYDPTAISAILGLAGLLCYLLIVLNRTAGPILKGVLIGFLILFTTESVMTFSRQGIYMEVGGAAVASYFLVRQRHHRATLVFILLFVILIFTQAVVPRLDQFTHGVFSKRFEQTDSTHRDVLAWDDYHTFIANPLLGVGPGRSELFRSIGYYKPHTEYTRLLSEHGIFGLLALLLLSSMLYRNWKSMGPSRVLLAPVMAWSMLFWLVNAVRLTAAAFLLGFSFVTVLSLEVLREETQTDEEEKRLVRRRSTSI